MNCILALARFPLLISLEVALSCPPICKYCSTGLAECEHVSSLQEVLSALPNSTEKILLRHGNLSKIPSRSFQNFPHLHLLSITGFLFSSLANLTFVAKDNSSLRSLDLSRNVLLSCGIQHLAFSGLGILEELILANNALDTLKSSWFLEMTLLTKLLLSDNKITYLPPRTFEHLAKLNELILSSNLIRYLSMDTFYGLASLTKLDLSSNEILFINNDVFQPLQTLKHLWLFKNKLTELASIPDSLTSLSLNENPWTCSCHLVSSMQLLKEKVQTPSGLVCNSPPSLRGHYVLHVGPEVCALPTPTGNLPQESTSKLNTLYGFAGGLFFSFITCLIVYFITKHWKYSRVTNRAEDGHVLQKDSVEEFPRSVSNAPSVIKVNRTKGFQEESEADTIEKVLCDHLNNMSKSSREHSETSSPVRVPGVALQPALSHTGKKIMTICKEEMETERLTECVDEATSPALQQVGKRTGERTAAIPRCVSAPGLLPNVEKEHSPKRDHCLHGPAFSREKTIQRREWMENGEPALVKYLETQWEEQASNPITWFGDSPCSRTLVNVVSPAGGAAQVQTGRDRVHTSSNKRSKSWSPFHFNISSHLTESHEESASRKNAENGFEANSTRDHDCETVGQGRFIKEQEATTTLLTPCINNEVPLTNKWEKGNYSTWSDVHTSFPSDGICHQDLPGDDSTLSCGLPQTIVQVDEQTNISLQETGAECPSVSKTIFEPISEFQESTKKCIVKDRRWRGDSLEQLQLGNASAGARRSENAGSTHVAQGWKSLDAETDSDALTQTHNAIDEHLAGGWASASPSILHSELSPVKSLQGSAVAPVNTCLPLSADGNTRLPDSSTDGLNISKVSLLDVHEVEHKGVADRRSDSYLSNEVVLVQKMHTSPSEEKNVGRLRDESADDEFLLNENEGAQFNSDEEKTKTFQSDCREHNSYELLNVISSNDTDDQKNTRELVTPSDNLRIDDDTWHNTDKNPHRSCLENSCSSVAADSSECDGAGCKKETGHEYLCQPAASKGCRSSPNPAVTVYESHAEEISGAGYDGTVSQSCQASSSTGIQQFACKKDKLQLWNIQVNPKMESTPDMKCSNSQYHMSVPGNSDVKLFVAGGNLSASPYLESSQPLEIGLHSKTICLPESHRSLPQPDSMLSISQKKELDQNWNGSPSAKQLKKTYYSVFKLPTEGSSFGKLCQNLDYTIDRPDLNKGVPPITTLIPTPCLLAQETVRHANGESWAFDPQLTDKATYLSCLYNPKTPRKQANELSVLSNLRYCKISAKVYLDMEEEEGRLESQKQKMTPPT